MKPITILITLLLLSQSALAIYPTNNTPEERRVFKIGVNRHFWISCESFSMAPTLSCNSTYWAYDPDPGDIQIGDIASYKIPPQYRAEVNSQYVRNVRYFIHRVVNITDDGFVFQGDNNTRADPWIVPFEDVRYILLRPETELWRFSPWQ